MRISYGITVHNESIELERLLNKLITHIDEEDEIVICVDGDDENVKNIIDDFSIDSRVIDYKRKLDGDFAAHKNSVIEKSTGDYVFHIDADEYPSDGLLEYVKPILEANDIDLIWVPRVNTVDGITEQHIQQWGWRVSDAGWVNYPDYQSRIFKNSPEIRWKSKVHERIHGAQTFSHLPPNETLSLYHPKTIDKQEEQNNFYSKLM